jgi:hypothetical protein
VGLTEPTLLALPAGIDIEPEMVNLRSGRGWVATYIELPAGYGIEHAEGKPYEMETKIEGELTARG